MWKRSHLWVLLALLAGLGLRLWFMRFHAHIEGDSLVYGDIAGNMLRHHVYGFTEPGHVRPTLIRLPGYPALMAACFAVAGIGHYGSVIWLQILIDLASCLLLAGLAQNLMGPTAGMCALWLGVLCPFTANYTAAPLTEIPAVFCVTLTFYSLERWWAAWRAQRATLRWACTLGAALSFAILLRPDRALLAVAAVFAMIFIATKTSARVRRAQLLQVAAVCCIIAAPLAAWAGRNWHVFHVFEPLAPRFANDPGEPVNFGFQRWYRTWAIDFKSTVDVYWSYDGATIYLWDLPPRAYDSATQQAQTAAIYRVYNDALTPTPAMDTAFAQIAADRVRAHPFRYYIELPTLRLANMWLRPRTEMLPIALDWWNFRAHRAASNKALAYALLNFAYLALAAVGLWRWRRFGWSGMRPLGYAMVAFVLLRSALLLTIDNSEPRYTIDCFPVVILFAAFALARSRASQVS